MDKTKWSKNKIIILSLVIIIMLLVAIILYGLVILPSFNNHILEKQIQAQQLTIGAILEQVQQQGYVQLFDAEGNTIVLVPFQEENISE